MREGTKFRHPTVKQPSKVLTDTMTESGADVAFFESGGRTRILISAPQ